MELTARKANKLELEFQIVLIKCITIALKHTFKGVSKLWGKEVDESTLQQAKNAFTELDRKRAIYESAEYRTYMNSNGSNVPKTKAHLNENGSINFVEAKNNASAPSIKKHLNSKQLILKQIKTNQMSTKKAAVKKATAKKATKVSNKKSTANKAYAPKTGTVASVIRAAYDKAGKGKFDKAAFAAKSGIPYHLVYGCITKYEAKKAAKK